MSLNFAELMFRVSNTEATVAKMHKAMPDKRIAAENWNRPPFSKRWKEVATVDQRQRDRRDQPIPPEIPLAKDRINILVRAWIEDGVLKCPQPRRQPTQEAM